MKNFKIECAGIDSGTFEYSPTAEVLMNFDYIYTNLSSNNDYLFEETISPTSKVITYSGFSDAVDTVLLGHLKTLGRKRVDILLVKEGAEILDSHKEIKEEHLTEAWGIQGNNLDEIKKTFESMASNEITPGYLATTVSPFDFDPELLSWAEQNQLEIIGINPMGGWLSAARNISAFTVPYLLGFAATYCKIVILSGRDPIKSLNSYNYLDQLVGKESPSMYSLKKTVHRAIKPLKTAINTAVSMADGLIVVDYVNPELLMNPEDHVLSLNVPQTKKSEETTEENDEMESDNSKLSADLKMYELKGNFVEDINGFLGILHYPSDGTRTAKFALARYKSLEYIRTEYKDYSLETTPIGPAVMMFTLTKAPFETGSLWWKKITPEEIRQYYLIDKGDGSFEFVETLPESTQDLIGD